MRKLIIELALDTIGQTCSTFVGNIGKYLRFNPNMTQATTRKNMVPKSQNNKGIKKNANTSVTNTGNCSKIALKKQVNANWLCGQPPYQYRIK